MALNTFLNLCNICWGDDLQLKRRAWICNLISVWPSEILVPCNFKWSLLKESAKYNTRISIPTSYHWTFYHIDMYCSIFHRTLSSPISLILKEKSKMLLKVNVLLLFFVIKASNFWFCENAALILSFSSGALGETALHIACLFGNVEVAIELARADPSIINDIYTSQLYYGRSEDSDNTE